MHKGSFARAVVVASWLFGLLVAACDGDGALPEHVTIIRGQVVIAGPLRGARLSVDLLDLRTGEPRLHLGDTVTSDGPGPEGGRFELNIGDYSGVLRFVANGGTFDDPASGATIEIDPVDEVRTVSLVELVEERDDILVGPIGHLIEARLKLALPTVDSSKPEPLLDAYQQALAVSHHFGRVVDWTRVKLVPLDQPAISPTEPIRASLVHMALSYLVHDIAAAAEASPQDVNVLALTRLWAADLSVPAFDGDPLTFDGNDGNAKGAGLQLGVCPPTPESCRVPATACDIGEPRGACRTACDLYSGTVRSVLGGELTKIIRTPEINGTGLNIADVLPVARAITESTEPTLFGQETCVETLDRVRPVIVFDAATPADGAIVRGTVNVRVTATDDIGVSRLEFGDGVVDDDNDPTNGTALAALDTSAITEGSITIAATASDQAGNTDAVSRTFAVDNVAPELSVDEGGFVTQAGVRWTDNPTPTLRGTARDTHGARVQVSIGGAMVASVDATGGAWSVQVPAAMLGTVPRDVTFTATDPIGNASSTIVRAFAVDTTAPALVVVPTIVKNETNDLITFAPGTGTPSHAHTEVGQATLDAGTGCPDVFKHAYLLEPGDANPIRWQLRAIDDGIGLDVASARYRIGLDDGSLVGPWRPALGSVSGLNLELPIDAVRSGPVGDAFLGTTEAPMSIELEVTDHLGRTSRLRRCWTHHPLAVPLQESLAAQVASGHPLALASNRLENPSPFRNLAAELINAGSKGLSVMDYDLSNGTLETSFVTFTLQRPTTTTRRDYVKQSMAINVQDLDAGSRIDCDVSPEPAACALPVHPPTASFSGSTFTTDNRKWAVRVVEVAPNGVLGAESPCLRCDATAGVWQFALAGKVSASGSARRYRVMTVLRDLTELAPAGGPSDPDPGPFADVIGITGKLIGSTYSGCTRRETVVVGPPTNPDFRTFCTQITTFQFFRALARSDVLLGAQLRSQPAAAPTAVLEPRSYGSLADERLVAPAPASLMTTETFPPRP